jgi:hypothetical protein
MTDVYNINWMKRLNIINCIWIIKSHVKQCKCLEILPIMVKSVNLMILQMYCSIISCLHIRFGLHWLMVFNATFNNISVISWRSVLLVGENGIPRENHRPVASHWKTLKYTLPLAGFELTALVVIGTDCTCSCKFN